LANGVVSWTVLRLFADASSGNGGVPVSKNMCAGLQLHLLKIRVLTRYSYWYVIAE
jgi:hypothetical protein